MLIDAGEIGNIVRDYISNQGIKRIDHIITTHPHADHIVGIADVINWQSVHA